MTIPAQAGIEASHRHRPEFILGPRGSADPWAGVDFIKTMTYIHGPIECAKSG